jgi:hypothetical protein
MNRHVDPPHIFRELSNKPYTPSLLFVRIAFAPHWDARDTILGKHHEPARDILDRLEYNVGLCGGSDVDLR